MRGAVDSPSSISERPAPAGEADLLSIGRALWAKKALIILPTLLMAMAAIFVVGTLTPMYRSEARVLVETTDTAYTRPENAGQDAQLEIDELAVESQVQIMMSRDLALSVIERLGLKNDPSFIPPSSGVSIAQSVLRLIGLARDTSRKTDDERALENYFGNLRVFSVLNSRVIVVQFTADNPEMAAKVTNAITDRYLELQQAAKQQITRQASDWLSSQITDLSQRVSEAEAKVESFRSSENLFIGNNNATLSSAQLGDLNTNLASALSARSDASAKAEALKAALQSGRLIESLDITNSDLIRNLAEQRAVLTASIARDERTFLPGHPRMKELNAQLFSLDEQMRDEARRLARAYENEANLASDKVESIRRTLDAQKKVAGTSSDKEVQLRALEREARAQRDLLEQFMARYRDAAARERLEATPADARVISRAAAENTPYFPKPLPTVMLATLATFALLVIGVTASEFMIVPPGSPSAPGPASSRRATASAEPRLSSSPIAPEPNAAAAESGGLPVFGRMRAQSGDVQKSPDMDVEAADMRMLGELANHLAAMPRGDGALNILTIAASENIDPGGIALSLARSLAGNGRKTIVVDAGGVSETFSAALARADESGLGELVAGNVSFGEAIQRDKASSAHLIAHGAAGALTPIALQRIGIVFDALGLTYDFVIVLAPSAQRAEEMQTLARRTGAAILVSTGASDAATSAAHDSLLAAGISDIVVLLAAEEKTQERAQGRSTA